MRKIVLSLICLCSLEVSAQDFHKNTLSTSLLRLESNSQTIHNQYKLKIMNGIEYQRLVNKWSFGLKYEHGLNKIEEYPSFCYDCFFGTGYLREDNFYLTSNYSVLNLFHSRLKLNTGLSFYYSNLNFSGNYTGGFSGGGTKVNSTFNTIGFAPTLSLSYFPTQRIVVTLNSMVRLGWSREFKASTSTSIQTGEHVVTAPELRVGFKF
jgi:hypothetical protein